MTKIQTVRRLFLFACVSSHALLSHAQHPADHWEFAVESGYLKKIRNNSPFDYRIVPTQVAWRSPAVFDLWRDASGARLTVRNRLAIVAETFRRGPEDYYLAFAPLWRLNSKTIVPSFGSFITKVTARAREPSA